MAIYDSDANAANAVTAWLAQFKVASTGAITFVSGTDTFHVKWIDRSLQKIVYDFLISGDDEVSLSYPNPSKSEALGKIITLYDHTTEFNVNYTVTDLVMESHFGGSVSQNGGDDIYYGLKIVGKAAIPMPIKVIQDHGTLTSHWGNGKNQTDSNTLARIMVKGKDTGVEIDNLVVNVKLDTWEYTYAVWATKLELGEAQASVSSDVDSQNTTLQATVEAYDVTGAVGYNLIDLDSQGDKPYIGKWDWGTVGNKKGIYEFVKSLLVDGTSETLYGVSGALWTGRLFDVDIASGTGTWVQDEEVSWGTGATEGTGNLVGVDDVDGTTSSRIILHLNTGIAPTDTVTVSGGG